MRTARMTSMFLAGALLLVACGEEDTLDEPPAEEAVTEDVAVDEGEDADDADDADDDAADGEEAAPDDDDDAAAAVPATVTLDGTELTPLPDTLLCVTFPDGTDRVVVEVADPAAADDDPEAQMSLVLDRNEDGSRVRIGTGLNLPEETNGEWQATPEDAEEAEIDPEGRTVATDIPLELRELNYDGDPQPQQRTITVDIDCS